nr:MAG TPA: hypothetical protein [Caudoviricetes sp.]
MFKCSCLLLLLNIIRLIYIVYCFFIEWEIFRCTNSTKCTIYKRTNRSITSMRAVYNVSFKCICLFRKPCRFWYKCCCVRYSYVYVLNCVC